jgi:hypothetical protein
MAAKVQTVRQIILAGAIYDILVVGLLAIPPLAPLGIDILFWVDQMLGDTKPLPALDNLHMLFACLFGLWVSAWSIMRFVSPDLKLVRVDLAMRIAVIAQLLWFVFATDTYRIIYLFIAADVIWVLLNSWGSRMLKDIENGR